MTCEIYALRYATSGRREARENFLLGDMLEGWRALERLAGDRERVVPGHDPLVRDVYPRAHAEVDAWALHELPLRSPWPA